MSFNELGTQLFSVFLDYVHTHWVELLGEEIDFKSSIISLY